MIALRRTCLSVASLALLSILSVPAQAGDADFTLVNRTGYAISEVYISPANQDAWGKDRLGRNVLDNGRSKLFLFSDKAHCVQDIKVVFDDDDSEVIWEDVNLCVINKITLRYSRKTNEVSAQTE